MLRQRDRTRREALDEQRAQLSSEELREHLHREEVVALRRYPVIAVGREAARAHHRVDVGMEEQLPRLRCAIPS